MTSSSTGRRYDTEIDLSNRNLSHTLIVELVGDGRRVLDLGCATGAVGAVLKQRGCHVVGVEFDAEAAALAADVLDDVVTGDVEELDIPSRFGNAAFDVVVMGDVLEHLRDPLSVLRSVRSVLAPGGHVVVSLPNVAHGAVRLALLTGRFEYQKTGLLDDTHMRFMTRDSVQALLAEAGFGAVHVERTTCGIFDSEIPLDPADIPPDIVESVEQADEATTYQFVVKAKPLDELSETAAVDHIWGAPSPPRLPEHRNWRERRDLADALVRSVATVATLLPPEPADLPAEEGSGAYRYGLDAAQDGAAYEEWIHAYAGKREADRAWRRSELARLGGGPSISVVIPVYRPDHDLLRKCVESVRNQDIDNWQLCLCNDSPDDPTVDGLLAELAALDSRIAVTSRVRNGGISAATNDAAALAHGEFITFADQDDELEHGALSAVALALAADPDVDLVYTDEDKLEPDGRRSEPFFKPDWSPDQLLAHMYVGHLTVVRRSLFERLGGLRPEFDGSQDYDFVLRATELARKVAHVPLIAYHWRKIEGSTASDYRAKPGADVAARAALADAMNRRGEEAVVDSGLHEGTFRVRRAIRGTPLVSIIVPFNDGAELLRRCVTSMQATAGYDHWEALLVDNRSWEPETRALLAQLTRDSRCRVVDYPDEFNWAQINNFAAKQAAGEHLLFLNADVEGTSDGWLAALVEHSQRPDIGAVGARLLYPDGRIQHAGVVMGLGGGVAWHAFCFCPGDHPGYFGQTKVIKNYSAVTGACMMVRKSVFETLGGFDEGLPVAYNDIDFCLRLQQRGLRVVYTPFAELIHEESAIRGMASREPLETTIMFRRWESCIRRDPYFNPNLDPRRSEHSLSSGLEEVDPWRNLVSAVESWLSRSGARSPASTPLLREPPLASPRSSRS